MKLHSERADNRVADGADSYGRTARAGGAALPLRSKVGGVLSGSLELLGERLNPTGWFSRGGSGEPKVTVSRLREVLDRDRALIAANPELNELADAPVLPATPEPAREPVVRAAPVAPPPMRKAPALPPAVESLLEPPRQIVCTEPIRTRTMARLLASQGHADRALSIYDYLLASPGAEPSLRAEAEALRAARMS
jgi:hypothetical protein